MVIEMSLDLSLDWENPIKLVNMILLPVNMIL
jgi:hypothetical protein